MLVNFTGYACTNCHWMKANMFPRPEMKELLKDLVLVELYTDGTDAVSEAKSETRRNEVRHGRDSVLRHPRSRRESAGQFSGPDAKQPGVYSFHPRRNQRKGGRRRASCLSQTVTQDFSALPGFVGVLDLGNVEEL